MIFKKALPRRTFLRGVGTTIALPFLESMIPAMASAAAVRSPMRFAIVYAPNGAIMDKWTPPTEGPLGDLPPILAPLQSMKDQLLVLSGLESKEAWGIAGVDVAGEHPRASAAFLTGVHVYSAIKEPKAGISIDQVIAREFKTSTELGSLELGIESAEILGACDGGCTYTNTICWADVNTPLPMENQPRAVFERLFGTNDTTGQRERAERIAQNRTILDFVNREAARLMRNLGRGDQHRVDQYLDALRDAERRIQMAEQSTARDLPTLQKPAGIPATVGEHMRLMLDLQVLAFQSDITRVSTLQIGHEMSNQSYPELGITDPYHPLTHHQGDPQKIAKALEVNVFHTKMVAYFLERLRAAKEADTTLFDNSIVIHGGGLSDGNKHLPINLPVVLAGGAAAGIQGGRHIRYAAGTPLCNLYLTLLDKLNISLERFGDSTGRLSFQGA